MQLLVIVAGCAVVAAGVVTWSQASPADIVGSDFTATAIGGHLLASGQASQLYDLSSQSQALNVLAGPGTTLGLPFVNPPTAAAIILPLLPLGLVDAYRIWSALQLVLLMAGVAFAVAPVRARAARRFPNRLAIAAICALALGSFPTFDLLRSGQWDGFAACGLGLGMFLWRRDRLAVGAAFAVSGLTLAKPHLAVCVLALVVGWRERRAVVGAASALGGILAVDVILVGPSGCLAYLDLVRRDAGAWRLEGMASAIALPGAWWGDRPASHLLGLVLALSAVALALLVGTRIRNAGVPPALGLGAASILGLAGALHAYSYDITLILPGLALWMAHRRAFEAATSPRLIHLAVILWIVCDVESYSAKLGYPTWAYGNLAVWSLVGLAALLALDIGRDGGGAARVCPPAVLVDVPEGAHRGAAYNRR